jgi:lambda family phage tail tape measure protein
MDLITLGVEVQTTGSAQAAQGLGSFQKAAVGAAGAADQLENKVNALGAAQTKSAAPARAMAGAIGGIGAAFKNNSSSIQNASFQLQDILVQLEMGVPISRTLGQQLPQLLGGFGPLGAVVGLAAGALLSFAPALFNASDGAKEMTDAVEQLKDAIDAYASASAAAASPTAKLIEQYGAASGKARELLQINKELAQLDALDKLAEASLKVVAAFGDFGGQTGAELIATAERAAQLREEMQALNAQISADPLAAGMLSNRQTALQIQIDQLDGYRSGVERVKVALGSTEQEAITFSAALADLQNALTLDDKIAAFDRVKALFIEITGGTENLTQEQRVLAQSMIDSALASLDLADGTAGAADNISIAATNAASLADELSRAFGNAVSLSQQSLTARTQAEIKLRYKEDPIGGARALAESRFTSTGAGALLNAPTGVAGFTQGLKDTYVENEVAAAEAAMALSEFNAQLKGGASSAKDITSEVKRYYDATRTEAEKYGIALDDLNRLHASGAMDADLYARALDDLNQKFDPLAQLVQGVADTVENELNAAFASVINGTADLGDALLSFASNVLAKVAQDLFAQQFSAPISAGLSGILGGLTGRGGGTGSMGLPMPFAKGGVVSGPTIFPFANGTGLMGEAGPEAIMPLSRGADGRLGVAAANGNSAPKITINNYSGQEASASSDGMGNILIEIGRAVAQDITAGGPTYKAIKTTFGISNRLQQRG